MSNYDKKFSTNRDVSLPLYLWIDDNDSILNVNSDSYLKYKYRNKDIFSQILKRYLSLYPTPCYRIENILNKFKLRYRPNISFYRSLQMSFSICIGLASFNEWCTATKCPRAARYARKEFEQVKRIKYKSQDEIDIFYMSLELKGIKSRS